jgi:hypothetical protein
VSSQALQQDGFVFAPLPESEPWTACTVRTFDLPDKNAQIFVATQRLAAGERLDTFATRTIIGLSGAQGFELLEAKDHDALGLRIARRRLAWTVGGAPREQVIVWFATPQGRLLTVSLTLDGTADAARRQQWLEQFEALVQSVRHQGDGPDMGAPHPRAPEPNAPQGDFILWPAPR